MAPMPLGDSQDSLSMMLQGGCPACPCAPGPAPIHGSQEKASHRQGCCTKYTSQECPSAVTRCLTHGLPLVTPSHQSNAHVPGTAPGTLRHRQSPRHPATATCTSDYPRG
eukprot:gene12761-biopygen7899